MDTVRSGLGLAALAGFLMYLAGEVRICDLGHGCGAGFPEWLYYGGAIVCVCAWPMPIS